MNERVKAIRPMRDLLRDLSLEAPVVDERQPLNAEALQRQIAENAETVMSVCLNGLAAFGHLLAHSSPVIGDGTVGADSVEALGWLMAELGDLASACMQLAAESKTDAINSGST